MLNSIRFGLASQPSVAYRSNSLLRISKYRILFKLLLIVVPIVYTYVYSLFNNVVEGVVPFIVIFCLLMIPELLVGLQHWGHEMRQKFTYDIASKRFHYQRGGIDLAFSAEEIQSLEYFCPVDQKGAMKRFQYLSMEVKGQRIVVSNMRFSIQGLLEETQLKYKMVKVALPLIPAMDTPSARADRSASPQVASVKRLRVSKRAA